MLLIWILGGQGSALVIAGRPATAGLVLVISFQLMIPSRALAGGGGGTPAESATYRWIISDQVGSGLVEVDKDGFRVRHTVYSPFGSAVQDAGTLDGRQMFAGHEVQQQTGLVYMKARWYDPGSGRFMSVDPVIDLRTPQAHNAYSYVSNNPVNVTDPTGAFVNFNGGVAAGLLSAAVTLGAQIHQGGGTFDQVNPNEIAASFLTSFLFVSTGGAASSLGGAVRLGAGTNVFQSLLEKIINRMDGGSENYTLEELVDDIMSGAAGGAIGNLVSRITNVPLSPGSRQQLIRQVLRQLQKVLKQTTKKAAKDSVSQEEDDSQAQEADKEKAPPNSSTSSVANPGPGVVPPGGTQFFDSSLLPDPWDGCPTCTVTIEDHDPITGRPY